MLCVTCCGKTNIKKKIWKKQIKKIISKKLFQKNYFQKNNFKKNNFKKKSNLFLIFFDSKTKFNQNKCSTFSPHKICIVSHSSYHTRRITLPRYFRWNMTNIGAINITLVYTLSEELKTIWTKCQLSSLMTNYISYCIRIT